MATTNNRNAPRAPITLKIKFKSETLEQFIERYSVDVSHGGIFIRTRDPLAVGTSLRFEFQLKDATPLISGQGTVVWTREHDPSRAGLAPGMGVRFDRMPSESQKILDQVLAQKTTKTAAPSNLASPAAGPESADSDDGDFVDTPTRVAPQDLVDSLVSDADNTSSADRTPLPTPRPFFGDADEFGADTFEEATRVAPLDKLVAQTAKPDDDGEDESDRAATVRLEKAFDVETGLALGAPLAARGDTEAEPTRTREISPSSAGAAGLRSAAGSGELSVDENARAAAGPPLSPFDSEDEDELEDSSAEAAEAGSNSEPSIAKALDDNLSDGTDQTADAGEAAQLDGPTADTEDADNAEAPAEDARSKRATVAPPTEADEESSGGSLGWVAAAAVILLIGGVGGFWFLRNKNKDAGDSRPANTQVAAAEHGAGAPSTGGAQPVTPTPDPATPVDPPAPVTKEVEITSTPEGATATLVGTDQSGATPHTFTIEDGKAYKIELSHPGYVTQTVDLAADSSTPETVELAEKSKVLRVSSTPSGAEVVVNGKVVGTSPTDVDLGGTLAKATSVRLTVRYAGYRPWVKKLPVSDGFVDEDDLLVLAVDAPLTKRAAVTPVKPPDTGDDGDGGGAATGDGQSSEGTGGTTDDGSGTDKPAGDKPAGDKPAGDKPAGDKPATDPVTPEPSPDWAN